MLREEYPDILHLLDAWHLMKNKIKDFKKVNTRSRSQWVRIPTHRPGATREREESGRSGTSERGREREVAHLKSIATGSYQESVS